MYYDTLTLAAVADELRQRALGARVQRVLRPTDLSLGLELYSGERLHLLISAEADAARLLLSSSRLRRGVETPAPLELLLRKYVRGARLEAVEQPRLERVLHLRFLGEEGPVTLVCELMGRYSNVILLDAEGVVLDALKRVPPSVNRYRSVLPQHPYVPPPPQDKADPLHLTPGTLAVALGAGQGDLARRLTGAVLGVSPIVAREVCYRVTGDADADAALDEEGLERLVAELAALFRLPETHAWQPCLAYEGEGEEPAAYAPYGLTHYPRREAVASISAAVERVVATRRGADPYRQVRGRLLGAIDERLAREEGRRASLEAALVTAEEIEALQARASAILAVAWTIRPGQTEVAVDASLLGGAGAEGETVTIPLDPTLSASENAQALFRRYRKLQAAAEEVPALLREVELEIAYLRQARTEALLAEDRAALDGVEAELREAGYLAGGAGGRRKAGAPREPLSVTAADGTRILVGRNSRENDLVTFRLAGPEDLWLHAHGLPGAHVIVRSGGAEVRAETLARAARLAAYYSAARGEERVQVDYTARRHVRPIKGARPGLVTYTHEETLVVTPEPPEDEG